MQKNKLTPTYMCLFCCTNTCVHVLFISVNSNFVVRDITIFIVILSATNAIINNWVMVIALSFFLFLYIILVIVIFNNYRKTYAPNNLCLNCNQLFKVILNFKIKLQFKNL
ncbi:hypothetical protein AK88_05514 [Plasmodium fragile]|uniref:Uncharacterized protein n=1 Tax=Plasmodium fragile TaxID=5857 RepID=A0A0D9QD02_PLAFR|nr:uncharacterized protein AK88_05514 [Plasmodium fragile]KJP84859.1 hypothetical protein AK88_05514 [Plasmodium fragile]